MVGSPRRSRSSVCHPAEIEAATQKSLFALVSFVNRNFQRWPLKGRSVATWAWESGDVFPLNAFISKALVVRCDVAPLLSHGNLL